MTFVAPQWLIAIPAIVGVAWLLARLSSKRRAELPGEFGQIDGEGRPHHEVHWPLHWRGRLEWTGGALVAAGLALPRFEPASGAPPRPAVLLVDVSRSMLAEDESGSRFDRARRGVAGALEAMAGRRVGLVTFAGSAEEVAPPTTDFSALRALLDEADPRVTLDLGSDAAAGLAKAIERLKSSGGDVVVFSDGEWDGDSGREFAVAAGAANVAIHVVPLGAAVPVELVVHEVDGSSTALVDGEGRRAMTRANRPRMEALAAAGRGRVVVGDLDERAFAFAGADRRGAGRSQDGWQPWSSLLAIAFVLLAAAHALRERVA